MSDEKIKITKWLAKQETTGGQTLFEGKVISETEKAIELKLNGQSWWIPKSQIKSREKKPPQYRKIPEIKSEDMEVRVIGTVVDVVEKGKFRLDDGAGQLFVLSEDGFPDFVELGTKLEVWGTPLNIGDSQEIQSGEIRKTEKGMKDG